MKKRLIDIKTLAKYISLSPQTIRNKLSSGTFPLRPIRIGRKLLWDKRQVDAYIAWKGSGRGLEKQIDLSVADTYDLPRKEVRGLPAPAFHRKERGL